MTKLYKLTRRIQWKWYYEIGMAMMIGFVLAIFFYINILYIIYG